MEKFQNLRAWQYAIVQMGSLDAAPLSESTSQQN